MAHKIKFPLSCRPGSVFVHDADGALVFMASTGLDLGIEDQMAASRAGVEAGIENAAFLVAALNSAHARSAKTEAEESA